ncbi:zinc finger protein 91-like [Anastrepha ludens]|uniref:zinc finger protein 91-like n=1 Tax=Anastrepha ludens TaxID=28586 RepID=UPI0023AEE882|nr:zinc finger protein 91-like [Anastrepha ludens]
MQTGNASIGGKDYNSTSTSASASADWHYWCRLCAKIDTHSENIFYEHQPQITYSGGKSDDNRCTMAVAIGKYFYVQIKHDDDLPKLLCTECISLVTTLLDFNERVVKVQEMYAELQSAQFSNDRDFQSIRLKYGILKEDPAQLYKHQHEEDCFTEKIDEASVVNMHNFEIKLITEISTDCMQTNEVSHSLEFEGTEGEDPFASGVVVETSENQTLRAIKECDGESNDGKLSDFIPLNAQNKLLKTEINTNEKGGASKKDNELKLIDTNRKRSHKSSFGIKLEKFITGSEGKSTDDKYFCSTCSLHFQRPGNFRVHMKKRHGIVYELDPLTCPQCQKSFKTEFKLTHHIKTHRPLSDKRIFPCPQCDRKFQTKDSVSTHIKFVHEDIRPFICEECGKGTRTETTLREHMLIHTDLAPFECEICKKGFKNQARLKNHMQIHSSSKHICRECGLQLNTRETLNRHMLVHSDIMRHKCDYCGRAFKRAKTLKNHLILHSGLKPYTCDFCDRTFATGANCRTHKRKSHPEELAALEASGEKTYTKNIPRLSVLKTVTQSAENLIPVGSKQNDDLLLGRKLKLPSDCAIGANHSSSLTTINSSAETVLSSTVSQGEFITGDGLRNGEQNMQTGNASVGGKDYNSTSTSASASADWHYWCRLCAKIDTHSENIFYEHQPQITYSGGKSDDNRCTMAVAIGKYFYVQIKHDDDLPKLLCTECISLVTTLLDFNERVVKVQEMYAELQSAQFSNDTDFQSIRLKYGILKEDPAIQHQDEGECFTEKIDEASVANMHKFEIKLITEVSSDGIQTDEVSHSLEFEGTEGEDPFASGVVVETSENQTLRAIKECDGESNDGKLSDFIPLNAQNKLLKTEINTNDKRGSSKKDKKLKLIDTNLKRSYKSSFDKKLEKGITGSEEKSTDDKYFCSTCSLHFQRPGNYRIHMKKRHGMALEPLTCSQCHKSFKTVFELNFHIKTHRPLSEKRILPCPQCDRKFQTKGSVARHIKFVHEDIRPFICEECGEGTRTETTLREHMLIHTDLAPFECEICKKCFKNQARLKNHMQIHSSSKHICRECGLQLNTRETLNRHMLVHSDIMRHKCDYCGRAFKRAKTLKSHLILHSGLKPYTCDFCDRTFANGANCRTHKRKSHPEELAALEASGEKTYTKNIPRLAALKTVTKPICTVGTKDSDSMIKIDGSAETGLSESKTMFNNTNDSDTGNFPNGSNTQSSFW